MSLHAFRASAVAALPALAVAFSLGLAGTAGAQPKPASEATAAANRAFGAALDLAQAQDFEDAARGRVARMPDTPILNAKGEVVWDPRQFGFIDGPAPASVNPSLWRQERLNNEAGLFKVAEGLWQIRGLDIANMTLVAGRTGWIVIDPLLSSEVARATLELAQQQLGRRPVVAVIYTHSHADHFGGVRGVVDEADVAAGRVAVVAPEGFMDHAIAENVLAGNAMSRRAQYQFGTPLPFSERGAVGSGLGKALSTGTVGLIAPTDTVRRTGEERVIDGVRFVFQMANGSEAPSEFTFYLPELKALCLSEVVTANMHNIYTLRGARTRDALGWSKYINEMLDLFPQAEVAFRSHHWPVWGTARIRGHLARQRDAYRFIHDAALHQANQGAKANDLGNAGFFPKGLRNDFSTRGYYGTLSHNLRGVYNFYLGFYDGNPATLDPLPVREAARRYVAALGGAAAVAAQARAALAAGELRWAAELNNHAVLADPADTAARTLQADILEQLGYRAESGVWRNQYLTAAQELREGLKPVRTSTQGPDMLRAMPMEMLLDFLAVRLRHEQVDGLSLGIQLSFSDTRETFALELSNAVLNHTRGRTLAQPDTALTLNRPALFKLLLGAATLPQLLAAGEATLQGDPRALATVFGNLAQFNPQFPIVTP